MLIGFSIIPIGSGSSLSDRLTRVMEIVDASGIPYKVNPMGTVMEGGWGELFAVVRECHQAVMKHEERVVTTITIDDRRGKPDRLELKVKSLEKKLGRTLKK